MLKVDLFPHEIYVFTPKGKIMELPSGSTTIDFAYAVHTDVGNQCIACRINRQLAPLSSQLQNGQTVQIITAPNGQPNPAWLNFVVTGKARSNIRTYLKGQRRAESLALGSAYSTKPWMLSMPRSATSTPPPPLLCCKKRAWPALMIYWKKLAQATVSCTADCAPLIGGLQQRRRQRQQLR